MRIERVVLKNWRNFREANIPLSMRTYIIGPNASGKSNLLDVFRFLRDVCKPYGGGLQKAVTDRGGISRLRCLHARRDIEVRIEIHLADPSHEDGALWRYVLGFKPEGTGAQRLLVSTEEVWMKERCLLQRPNSADKEDKQLLTQTHLEQIQANAEFRELADFFSGITYLHLVPQLLKYGDRIGGNRLEDDPFGQGFLERIAKAPSRVRDSRLKKIGDALSAAVPQFKEIRYKPDEATGRPHLEARYEHFRPNAGWQREEHFSDGTLRLLGLLWSLLENDSLLLLEEPELSLHTAVVEQIPLLVERIQRASKIRRQVIMTTHSVALLSNPGIDARGVIVLEPAHEGTNARTVTEEEAIALNAGLSVADVLLPKTRPKGIEQLGLW
ncbi:MAG: AAA family ATPase [Thiohalomonadaceae bacterium]